MAAEVAVGAGAALAVYEVASTTAEVGVAGYLLAKPTMPLKATYTMVANAFDDETSYVSSILVLSTR
jgi:hypothetical protein